MDPEPICQPMVSRGDKFAGIWRYNATAYTIWIFKKYLKMPLPMIAKVDVISGVWVQYHRTLFMN